MKKSTIFLLCLIGYLIFIFLIFTEPLGYNPIMACGFSFILFAVLYFFLTQSYRPLILVFEKMVPDRLLDKYRQFSKRFDSYSPYISMFFVGWSCHQIWVVFEHNAYLLLFTLAIGFIAMIIEKNNFEKRSKS